MRTNEFRQGFSDGLPICLGYFSVSVAYGMTAVLSGIPVWAAVLISLTNLTSAGQFAGTNLMTAGGSLAEIGMTTLIINIRYFLMSLAMSQKVEKKMGFLERLAVSFGITDEIFAVSMQHPRELSTPYMAGLISMPVLGWTGGTLAGGILTSFLPEFISNALAISLYGMFIAVIIPPVRESKAIRFTILLAVVLSILMHVLPGLKELSSGWGIIIITVIVSGAAAWLFPVEEKEETV